MKIISIESTVDTPSIVFDFERGSFCMQGRSALRYPTSFYKPILSSLENYVDNAADVTIVNMDFDFVNNASTKWVFEILKNFEKIHKMEKTVLVKWYYVRESQRKMGFYFQELLSVPFKMIKN